jgi:FKBP-type peptidyl-prolyl cis-trans isomerase
MNIVSTGIAVALALLIVGFFFLPGLFPFRAAPQPVSDESAMLNVASTTGGTSGEASAQGAVPASAPVTTADGLKMQDVVVGSGVAAKAGDTVTVNYVGKLADGTTFDASANHGSEGFSFPLGAGHVIRGWDEGVAGMKVGGTRILVIPPGLGYGAQGAGSAIPPNATLTFEVQLLKIGQ